MAETAMDCSMHSQSAKSQIIGNRGKYRVGHKDGKNVGAHQQPVMEGRQEQNEDTPSSNFNFTYSSASGGVEEISDTPLHPILANCNDFFDPKQILQENNNRQDNAREDTRRDNQTNRKHTQKSPNVKSYPVINSTLASQQKGLIVLVKIVEESAQHILNNPIKVAKLIKGSIFDTDDVRDLRTDKRRSTVIIELREENADLMREFLAVTRLGADENVKVECSVPKNELHKFGVISPVSTTATMEELMEVVKVSDGHSGEIVKMERLKKKDSRGLDR